MKSILAVLAFACMGLVACDSNSKSGAETNSEQAETTATYSCPMQCEGDKTYTEEGKCPVCEMDLVAVE